MHYSNGDEQRDPPLVPRKVLLVEDNPDSAYALTRLLTAYGHIVRHASSGAEALSHAAQDAFDVVISDLNLPDTDGYELLAELRRISPLPGIALTGYADQAACESRCEVFDAHLRKPASLERLLALIEALCGARQSQPVRAEQAP